MSRINYAVECLELITRKPSGREPVIARTVRGISESNHPPDGVLADSADGWAYQTGYLLIHPADLAPRTRPGRTTPDDNQCPAMAGAILNLARRRAYVIFPLRNHAIRQSGLSARSARYQAVAATLIPSSVAASCAPVCRNTSRAQIGFAPSAQETYTSTPRSTR